MKLDPTFVLANYVESCVWLGIGVVAFLKRTSKWSIGLAGAFVAFGASDIVETRTGAWYTPWWMLTWKILSVLLIVICGYAVLRISRRKRGKS